MGAIGTGSADGSLIGHFLRSLGGSLYFGINSSYTSGSGAAIANSVDYTFYWANNTNAPSGTQKVTDTQMIAMLQSGFDSKAIAYDASTLYLIFTAAPNGDPGADGEVSVLAHAIEETTTDMMGNAWYDSRGYENADKCAWTFGTTYNNGTGIANVKLPAVGGKDFLVQQNWKNTGSGGCAMHL